MSGHGSVAPVAQSYLVVALAAGLVVGLVLGGRPRHLAQKRFRWWLLLPLGVVLQLVVEADGVPAPHALLIVSYVYLLVFCIANLRHVGMGLILVGIALNAVVIVVDNGMPVREKAVYQAAIVERGDTVSIDEIKHHLETPDDDLMVLADIIPVKPLHQVLSFGDLILSVGVADLLVHLLLPVGGRRRRLRGVETSADAEAAQARAGTPHAGTETDEADRDEQRVGTLVP
jgi:hypothetical protein